MTLTCPSDANMAAVAKQLHATALQAEAEIYASEQLMRSAVNLPTVVVNTTAAYTNMPANIVNELSSATWFTVFDNTFGGSGFGPQNFSTFTQRLGEGLYEVGLCATFVAMGAVNDNSVRFINIDQYRPDPTAPTGESIIQRSVYTQFETNTGVGTEVAFLAEFRAKPSDRFAFQLLHGNTSSDLQMNAGAYIWASKLSETNLTRVL